MPRNENQESMAIKRAKCDSINIYEVTEAELGTIKNGNGNGLFLNLGIFFISIFISFLITLLTVKIDESEIKLYSFFLFSCIITAIAGLVLLLVWYKSENPFKLTIKRIEERMKDEVSKDISTEKNVIELAEE